MDWHDYVRAHLPPLAIAAERETGVVDELALQLEAIYERAVAGGATHDEAVAVMRHSLAIGAAGIACGLAAAIALAGVLQSALVDTAPRDPMILAAAAGLLLAVTAAAAAMPARRAMRIDPVTALRTE